MARRIHVALNVTDLPAAVAFYRAMFAAEPLKDLPDFAKFVLDDPLLNLALSTRPPLHPAARRGAEPETGLVPVAGAVAGTFEPAQTSPGTSGTGPLSHLGLQVESDGEVAQYEARWAAAGLPLRVGRSVADSGKVWVYDPDGNEWEVFAE